MVRLEASKEIFKSALSKIAEGVILVLPVQRVFIGRLFT